MYDADSLAELDWFSELDSEEFAALRARAVHAAHPAGGQIFAPTHEPRSVYLLGAGSVRIYRISAGGEEATLGYVAPGEVFGELPGLGKFPRDSFAVAHAASVVWKIPVEVFRTLVRSHPSMMGEVIRQVGERMKRVEARVEDLILRDVRLRLASALLELSEHLGDPTPDGIRLRIQLSQMQLGTLIGATRQSVNAAMAAFQTEGLVRQRGTSITVSSPAGLRALLDTD